MLNLLKKWVRILWTLFTYPLAVVAGIPGAVFGAIWGFYKGIRSDRGLRFSTRTGLQIGLVRGARDTFAASTWLYKRIFLRDHEREQMPSFFHPQTDLLIIGHRGAPYKKVENTLQSFGQAIKEGANALEIDLCLTRDGTVVVWHDWNPDSTVARYRESGLEACQKYRPYYPNDDFRRPVTDLSLDELRLEYGYARRDGSPVPSIRSGIVIPTFDEFMYWAGKRKTLRCVFLDIKIPDTEINLVEPFLAEILRSRNNSDPHFELVFLSPYPKIVEEIKRLEPDLEVCFDREMIDAMLVATESEALKFSTIRPAEAYGNQFASVGRPTVFTLAPFEVYKKIIVEDLRYRHEHCLNTRIIAWTINDPREMSELLELGVDGILTDYPYKLARRVRNLSGYDVMRTARNWLGVPSSRRSASSTQTQIHPT
jgi:glycerophosphoryl diester phosphodiesterase